MKYFSILFFLILSISTVIADDYVREINLKGKWRFEPGDDADYSNPDYDDSHWESIIVPTRWEKQGFPGYDGYAWYRKNFNISDDLVKKRLILNLGYIDDVYEIFINGKKLGGKGTFPPNTRSAHNELRLYELPHNYLNFDKQNIIAIRVYDYTSYGGITEGDDIGIYSSKHDFSNVHQDLAGTWKFSTGNDKSWASPVFDDSAWEDITVPGQWETQGYPGYNGFAWYRKHIVMNSQSKNIKFILMLGKIDDFDEVYFKGVKIGHTGPVNRKDYLKAKHSKCTTFRYYFIPSHLIRWDKKNTLAVCVYDMMEPGGILYGPLGIITRDQYKWHQKKYDKLKYYVEKLFD